MRSNKILKCLIRSNIFSPTLLGIFLVVTLVIAISVARAYRPIPTDNQPQSANNTGAVNEWRTYRAENNSFTVQYPANWTANILSDLNGWSSEELTLVILSDSYEATNTTILSGAHVKISVGDIQLYQSGLLPLGEYQHLINSSSNSDIGSVKLLNEEEVFVDGLTAIKRTFSGVLGVGQNNKRISVTFAKGDVAIRVSCDISHTHESLSEICDDIIYSLKFQ